MTILNSFLYANVAKGVVRDVTSGTNAIKNTIKGYNAGPGAPAPRARGQMSAAQSATRIAEPGAALRDQSEPSRPPHCPFMIGEPPEWALWLIVGLLVFLMFLPTQKR